jgi:hypothetical protein
VLIGGTPCCARVATRLHGGDADLEVRDDSTPENACQALAQITKSGRNPWAEHQADPVRRSRQAIPSGDPVQGDPVQGDPVQGDPVQGDAVEPG